MSLSTYIGDEERPPCAEQQRRRSTALSSRCGQRHVESRRRRLNTELFLSYRTRACVRARVCAGPQAGNEMGAGAFCKKNWKMGVFS